MNKEIIKLATEKKYTEFSNAIKSELNSKLSSHEVVSDYVEKLNSIEEFKNSFAEINSKAGE